MSDAANDGEPTPTPPAAGDPPPFEERMWREVVALREVLAATQDRLTRVEAALEAATKQVSYVPAQIRNLAGKVEGLASAVSEPRLRALLLGLLGVYDLLGPAGRRDDLDVPRTQLRQLLTANGLEEIPADGEFNPELHRALRRVPCADPASDNRVVEVVRVGFRTGQAVLRYAEVFVGQYAAPAAEAAGPQPVEAPEGPG